MCTDYKRQGYCCHVQCSQTTKDKDTVAMFSVHRQQKTRILLPCSMCTDNKRQGYCCYTQCSQPDNSRQGYCCHIQCVQTTGNKDTLHLLRTVRQQIRILLTCSMCKDNKRQAQPCHIHSVQIDNKRQRCCCHVTLYSVAALTVYSKTTNQNDTVATFSVCRNTAKDRDNFATSTV